MSDGKEKNDLLKRARRLERKAGRAEDSAERTLDKAEGQGSLIDEAEDAIEDIRFLSRTVQKLRDYFAIAVGAAKPFLSVASKILSPVTKTAAFIGGAYKNRVWDKYAYDRDEEGVMMGLNRNKAAKVVMLTAAFMGAAYFSAAPLALTARDAFHVARATEGQEFFFGKPEYKADKGIYQVTACKSQTTCEGGDNALIFDIPDNRYLDLTYTFTRAKGYDPEHEIVSAFNSEYQQCSVTAFGSSPIIINYFFGTFKWHPKIIDQAVCTPVVNMNGPSLTN
jgi:hypothetical protein